MSTLLSYLTNCAATQGSKLAMTRGSKRGDIRPLRSGKSAAGLPPTFSYAGSTPLVARIRASKLLPTLRYIKVTGTEVQGSRPSSGSLYAIPWLLILLRKAEISGPSQTY